MSATRSRGNAGARSPESEHKQRSHSCERLLSWGRGWSWKGFEFLTALIERRHTSRRPLFPVRNFAHWSDEIIRTLTLLD